MAGNTSVQKKDVAYSIVLYEKWGRRLKLFMRILWKKGRQKQLVDVSIEFGVDFIIIFLIILILVCLLVACEWCRLLWKHFKQKL